MFSKETVQQKLLRVIDQRLDDPKTTAQDIMIFAQTLENMGRVNPFEEMLKKFAENTPNGADTPELPFNPFGKKDEPIKG